MQAGKGFFSNFTYMAIGVFNLIVFFMIFQSTSISMLTIFSSIAIF